VKCIAWSFDGLDFVSDKDKKKYLRMLRFENGDTIPNVKNYFSE
jgi:hypothetical protein